MHSNGLKLEEFSISSQFWGSKMQKINFLKNLSVLRAVFIKLKFRWLQTRLADLRNTKHLIFYLWPIFYDFCFINLNFCIFWYFQKSSAAHTKIVECVLFNETMLDQPQLQLHQPIFKRYFFQDWCSLPVLTRNFNGHLNGICKRCFDFF